MVGLSCGPRTTIKIPTGRGFVDFLGAASPDQQLPPLPAKLTVDDRSHP